jgi:hypothetical protein
MSTGVNFKPAYIGDFYGNGSGQSVGLSQQAQAPKNGQELFASNNDSTATAKNVNDPIYVIFDQIDNQPLSKIAADFIKDTITTPVAKFIVAVSNSLSSQSAPAAVQARPQRKPDLRPMAA